MQEIFKKVCCIDGDGALLMHMGNIALLAKQRNLIHVVILNGTHESVGGQPTAQHALDFCALARSSGFRDVFFVENQKQLQESMEKSVVSCGSCFVLIKTTSSSRKDLGRPEQQPSQNKRQFMKFLARL